MPGRPKPGGSVRQGCIVAPRIRLWWSGPPAGPWWCTVRQAFRPAREVKGSSRCTLLSCPETLRGPTSPAHEAVSTDIMKKSFSASCQYSPDGGRGVSIGTSVEHTVSAFVHEIRRHV